MLYTEMVKEIAARNENLTQANVKAVLNTLVEIAESELKAGKSVTIDNFLKVSTTLQKGRKGIIQLGAKAGSEFTSPNKIVAKAKIMPRFQAKVSTIVED